MKSQTVMRLRLPWRTRQLAGWGFGLTRSFIPFGDSCGGVDGHASYRKLGSLFPWMARTKRDGNLDKIGGTEADTDGLQAISLVGPKPNRESWYIMFQPAASSRRGASPASQDAPLTAKVILKASHNNSSGYAVLDRLASGLLSARRFVH